VTTGSSGQDNSEGKGDLSLDRMLIAEVGANPQRLAAAIHAQLGDVPGPVPIAAIAHALDIVEIRAEPMTSIEGALLTTPERSSGKILLNARSSPQRRRFTLGHELGHFLNDWHRPTSPDGFRCSRADMIETDSASQNRHRRQEAEANRFAIELLAPRAKTKPYLRGGADLRHVLAMAEAFDISRAAAARRYVELHGDALAVIFSRNGRFLYADRTQGFPGLCFGRDAAVPRLPTGDAAGSLSVVEEMEAEDWLAASRVAPLHVQTLHQQEGHAMSLLRIDAVPDDDDDGGLDDAYERFERSRGR
jgi:hypothetical protein